MGHAGEEVWITGIGLVSSLGEGVEDHWRHLAPGAGSKPVLDTMSFAPYTVHPLVSLDLSAQIPRRSDQRQMEPWQRLNAYAAGLALADAGIEADSPLRGTMDMIVAADGGERDIAVDSMILEGMAREKSPDAFLNASLMSELRPTLFLAQLPNLVAGNISIVHKVVGSSRTFMGEELAGASAAQVAVRKIRSGQSKLCLVGGAFNAERQDMLLLLEFGQYLWPGEFAPVWERFTRGGGVVPGSVGAFLVLESHTHAEARGAGPYARITDVCVDRCRRAPGEASANAELQFDWLTRTLPKGPMAVLSGACGAEPVTGEELSLLDGCRQKGFDISIRAFSSMLGHCLEAQFPAGLALAAIAVWRGQFFDPFDDTGVETRLPHAAKHVLVTCWGHWRGEALALVEQVH